MRKSITDYVFYFAIILIIGSLVYYFFIRDNNQELFLLKEEKINLSLGEKKDINDYIVNNTNGEVTYFSADNTVVTISYGKITAVGRGNTSIIFSYTDSNGETISRQLFVNVSSNNNDDYSFENKILLLNLGDKVMIEEQDNVTFSANDSKIISKEGNIIHGISVGKTTINAFKNGEIINSLVVYVMQNIQTTYMDIPTNITIIKDDISIKIGESYQVEYVVNPESISKDFFEWESTDNTVATVENGKIVGVNVGHTVITMKTKNGLKSSLLVNVVGQDIERIDLTSNNSLSLAIGENSQITYNLYPSNADNGLVFESSNSSIVTVSDTGLITAIKDGDALVTMKNKKGDISVQISVHVKQDSSNWSGVNKACNNSDPADTEFNSCFVKSHHLIINTSSITISPGSSGMVQVTLPPECGTNIGYTRKSPDGETGWRNYLTQEITNETTKGFTWVITPNDKASGKDFVASLTIQYDSRSPSGKCVGNVKSMITLEVKVR